MCRIEGNAKITGVMCERCSHVTEIKQDLDANGREKALLRDALAKQSGAVASIEEDFEEYKRIMNEARTADACRFAEFLITNMEAGAKNLRTLEDMSRELKDVRWAIAAMAGNHNPDDLAKIARLEAEVRDLQARIENYYETLNSRRGMPSLYDAEVKKFDEERAEACGRPVPEARRGPPMGHPGSSHHVKPEGTIRCRLDACPLCGTRHVVRSVQPESKTFIEMDEPKAGCEAGCGCGGCGGRRVRAYQLVVERGWCRGCGMRVRSPVAPDIQGTWYGPRLLSKLLVLYALTATDRKLSRYLESLIGSSACASTIWNGRRAAARVLEPFMKHLEKLLTATGWGHFDETTMRMFGGQGYLWLLSVACAAMVVARPSRGKGIFDEEFAFARRLVGVVDGYKVYEIVLDEIQRCWRHVINNFKAAAVRSDDPDVVAAYDDFCALYDRVKGKDTAPEAERAAVVEEARAIARRLPEGHSSRVEIENAAENLVTFLKFKGMSPTNNPAESDIRRVPVAQRNARYQLRTKEGARVFSIMLSFILTCDKQGIPLDEAFVALARGADPADLFKVGQVAPNRWGGSGGGPKRCKRGPLDGLMPPERAAAGTDDGAAPAAPAAPAANAGPAAEADAGIREAAAAEEAARAKEAAAAEEAARAKEAAAAEARILEAAAAEEAARAKEAAAAEARILEAAAAEARILEAASIATARRPAQKAPPVSSPPAPPPMPPRTVAPGRQRRDALSLTAPSTLLRAGSRPSTPRLRHVRRPAFARLRRPPKPPPTGIRPCSLRQSRRQRPANWHVPIKPSVPPPCKPDDPDNRVRRTKSTRLDRPICQGTGVQDPSPTGV